MTRKYLPLAWLLPLGLLLAGCGTSPPNQYYVLSAHEFAPPSGLTPALGVGPISVPEYLNRKNLVYNTTENALQVAGTDLWGEPLEAGIGRVLQLNLAGLLNTQNVRAFPWHALRAPDFGVRVNLLQLDADGNTAMLTAEWLVYRASDDSAIERRISRLQAPLASGTSEPAQVAAAYSTLLYQLSEIIAAAIASEVSAGSTRVAS